VRRIRAVNKISGRSRKTDASANIESDVTQDGQTGVKEAMAGSDPIMILYVQDQEHGCHYPTPCTLKEEHH
jgi:hypothetical protein